MDETTVLSGGGYLQHVESKETCEIGGDVLNLPLDLCQHSELLCDILSLETWYTVFTQAQRSHLETYLPQGDEHEKIKYLKMLLGGENIRFGNPLLKFCEKLKNGCFNPLVVRMNTALKRTKMKNQRFAHKKYISRLVSDVLLSHRKTVGKLDEDLRLKIQSIANKPSVKSIEDRVMYRYFQETYFIRRKVDEEGFSSCDEHFPCGPPPKLFCYDSTSNFDFTLIDSVYTSLQVSGSDVNDELQEKVLSTSKRSQSCLNFKKIKRFKHKKSENQRKSRKHSDTPILSESNYEDLSDEEQAKVLPDLSPGTCEDLKSETYSCYFALLRDIFLSVCDQQLTLAMLQEGIRTWMESPVSSLNDWYYLYPNWMEILSKSILYLASPRDANFGEKKPLIEVCSPKSFKWIGTGCDSDSQLKSIFIRWMEMLTQCDDTFKPSLMAPAPRNLTSWKVRPSLPDERERFQIQERERFFSAHKCYAYKMHGYEALVGPVRGVTGQNLQSFGTKAREHSLLVSSRPSFVTILTLVGDAVARLPNGEGTRSDICELLKDSQYLLENSSESTLNTVVSGALDRLQQGSDPSVKYDPSKKLWVYLYRDKGPHDYESLVIPTPPLKVMRKNSSVSAPTDQEKLSIKSCTATSGGFITSPVTSGVIKAISPTFSCPPKVLHMDNVSLNNLNFPVNKLNSVLTTPTSLTIPSTPVVTSQSLSHPSGKSILLQSLGSPTQTLTDPKIPRPSVAQSPSGVMNQGIIQSGASSASLGVQNSVKIIKVMAPHQKPLLKTVVLTPTGENGNLKQVIVNSQTPRNSNSPSLLRTSLSSQPLTRGKTNSPVLQTVRLSRDKTGQIIQLPTPSCSTPSPVRFSLVSRPGTPLARLITPRAGVNLASFVNRYQPVNRQPVLHVVGSSPNNIPSLVRVVAPTSTTASNEGMNYDLTNKRSVNVMLEPRTVNPNSAVVLPSPSTATMGQTVTLVPSNISHTLKQKVFSVRPPVPKNKVNFHPKSVDPCQITQDETLAAIASISGHYQDDS